MSTTNTELSQLIAQRDTLDRQIKEMQLAARTQAISEVKRIMFEFDLTVADLGGDAVAKRGRKARTTEETEGGAINPFKPKPKYRDGSGNTWAGRGLKPVWLRTALEQNPDKTLENFLIKD